MTTPPPVVINMPASADNGYESWLPAVLALVGVLIAAMLTARAQLRAEDRRHANSLEQSRLEQLAELRLPLYVQLEGARRLLVASVVGLVELAVESEDDDWLDVRCRRVEEAVSRLEPSFDQGTLLASTQVSGYTHAARDAAVDVVRALRGLERAVASSPGRLPLIELVEDGVIRQLTGLGAGPGGKPPAFVGAGAHLHPGLTSGQADEARARYASIRDLSLSATDCLTWCTHLLLEMRAEMGAGVPPDHVFDWTPGDGGVPRPVQGVALRSRVARSGGTTGSPVDGP